MSLRSVSGGMFSTAMIPTVFTGIVIGAIDLFIELSFAALLFSGPLAAFIPSGFGLILTATIVLTLVTVIGSSFAGSIAIPQDLPTAILALVAVGITGQMTSALPSTQFATVVSAMVITSLLTGATFFLVGRFRLSVLARYLPYPVIGGFLAATGFLLMQGALGVMTNLSLNWSQMSLLLAPALIWKWLPGVMLGVALLLVLRRVNHFLVLPVMLLGAMALFHAWLLFNGVAIADMTANGWLIATPDFSFAWQPMTLDLLARADWQVISSQGDKIATVMFISVIGMLLNVSGLELVVRQDLNLDRELKVTGLANALAGAVGGPVGYHALSLSALAHRSGGNGRLVGLVSAGVMFLAFFFGTTFFAYVPRWVMGGVLFFLGLAFLVEWLYDAWFKMARSDYALVVAILAVSVTIGFLEGVEFGVFIAILLFVVNYSRVHVVTHALTGSTYRSTVDRSPHQRALLRTHGEELVILQLQEYIFFGTAQRLAKYLQERIADRTRAPVRFVVLDFRRVSGLDSSAVAVFMRLKQLAQAHEIQLVLTQLNRAMHVQLVRAQVLTAQSDYLIRTFDSLDHGVEWCENEILRREGAGEQVAESLQLQLGRLLDEPAQFERLLSFMEYRELPAHTRFIHQGEPADAMYFLEAGSVAVELETTHGTRVRLRTIRSGCVVGETAMYMGGIRTASVETMEPSRIYRLTTEALARLEMQEPMIASVVHKWTAAQIAERLADNVRALDAMLR